MPVFRGGQRVYDSPSIDARSARTRQLAGLHPGIKRFVNPHHYPVGLAAALELKTRLVLEARRVGWTRLSRSQRDDPARPGGVLDAMLPYLRESFGTFDLH